MSSMQTALTCLIENLWGYIRGRAANGEDRFGHDHRKSKVTQFQSTDASSSTFDLRDHKPRKKAAIWRNLSTFINQVSAIL